MAEMHGGVPGPRVSAAGGQRFHCDGCTHCCRSYDVPLQDEGEAERIRQLVEQRPELCQDAGVAAARSAPKGPGGELRWYVGMRTDGRCVFLTDGGRCALHERAGEQAKPLTCRRFPYRLVRRRPLASRSPEQLVASVSFECLGLWRSLSSGPELGSPSCDLTRLLAAGAAPEATVVQDPGPLSLDSRRLPSAQEARDATRQVLAVLKAHASQQAAELALSHPRSPWAPEALRRVAVVIGCLAEQEAPEGSLCEPSEPSARVVLRAFSAAFDEGGRALSLLRAQASREAVVGLVGLLRRLVVLLAGGDRASAEELNLACGRLERSLDGVGFGPDLVERLTAMGRWWLMQDEGYGC